jgi:gliding motility associated protien GldN
LFTLKSKKMTRSNFITHTLAAALVLAGSNLFAQSVDTELPPNQPGAVNSEWRWSLTPNGGYDHIRTQDSRGLPLPWQSIRESDLSWRKRVWREIDVREKQNVAFTYAGDEHTGGGMFIEILTDAVRTGKVAAYATADDRFTTPFSKAEMEELLKGKPDTGYYQDPVNDAEIVSVTYKDFNPATITKYRLIEDWMFDNNTGKMVVHIVGIAPVRDIYGSDGQYRGSQAMFWLYYPDIRGLLARYQAVNPANDMHRATWDEFFEDRKFASRILKVSNPHGPIAGSYGQGFTESGMSPMEALYEDKRAANDIFNKEHDMWAY